MSRISILVLAALFVLLDAGCAVRAGESDQMDAAALQARAAKPWDKASLMGTTVVLGSYRGVPVVAEHPCSDVCPQYTVRIIHYQLPVGASCASVGGAEKQVLVPIAITVRPKTFCIPEPLVASGLYFAK
ncbi:MAG: hypothetical protein ABI343_19680 [Burkholderiaceae bacterium]